MILYQLRCVNDHEFEAWFRSSDSFTDQVAAGDVECPFCGEVHVSKAMMAPRIAKGGLNKLKDLEAAPAATNDGDERRAQDLARQILRAVDKLRDHVEENFEDVGADFAKEARKIHSGESSERGIYGSASDEEAHALDEDGVEYFRLPVSARRDS